MKRFEDYENFKIDYKFALPVDFFQEDTTIVAKKLIGKLLVKTTSDNKILAGMIAETEAYLSENDLSSHSYPGLTKRNAPMFEDGGILYVYKIYGIHHCVNIVTETKGKGCAVLIRAIVPILGIDIMKNLRNNENIKTLCKGPGNLTKAFDFNTNDNFKSVCSNELFLQDFKHISNNEIITTERIGITKSKELKLRYVLNTIS